MPVKLTFDNFIEKANKVHNNKYNYSKFSYINLRTKGIIICKIHGDFLQSAGCHLYGNGRRRGSTVGCGCPKCKGLLSKLTKVSNINIFLEKVKHVKEHIGKNYSYSKFTYINRRTKSIIICPKHGEFLQTPSDHLNGYGCPYCCSSKGEQYIKTYLIEHNIPFIHQFRFKKCKYKRTLPFDFYLPQDNICIEYQGQQHFNGWNGNKNSLDIIQRNDIIKRNFCNDNGIKLVEIKYTDNIDIILNTIRDKVQ